MSHIPEPNRNLSRPEPQVTTVGVPCGLGPYTDLAAHARGGLGEVLRGTDPVLHRTVALKRLQERLADHPDSRRRFLLEAEITARLEHPGVVPVYGLFYEDGDRPVYAMRFVQGPTLWDAIQTYHAGPPDPVAFRRLLQAFLHVCQTVAYAHSRGIIHRDLKPQNIMLGKFGETLVVDWGLAKVVGRLEGSNAGTVPEETLVPGSESGGETAMGSAVGTPAYMSPEQAAGRWDVIDHATDVYGLGAVLYTVLTGKPPLERGNWPQMQQRIQRGDFPRPRQVTPAVPKPLESVCLRAMAVAPPARYPSAAALGVDVEHWLADEPVAAYREPLLARGRRWLRRHRSFVVAAAVLLVAALAAAGAGLVLLGWKNRQIVAERNATQRAADEVEAVNAFLTDDLLGQANPDVNARDKKVTVEEVLAKAAKKIDGNPKFVDKPAVEATLRLTIGKTYFQLGNLPEAEKHLRRAMDLRREHLPRDDPTTLAAQEAFADFLNRGPGRYAEALPLARQTWEGRAGILGTEHTDTLDSLDTYATALRWSGRVSEAVTYHRECLSARQRVLGPDNPATLTSMNNLAAALLDEGEYREAVPLLREVHAIRSGKSRDTAYTRSLCNLVWALYMQGDLDEAEKLLQKNVDWATQHFGPDHELLGRMRGLRVRVWIDQGRVEPAVALGREVVALRRQIFPANHLQTAHGLADLGRGLVLLGRYAEAEEALTEALGIYAKTPALDPYFSAWAECWAGASLTGLGRHADAEARLLAAARKLRETPSTPPRHYREAVGQLVKHYEAWDKPEEAAEWRKALAASNGSSEPAAGK